MMQQLATSIIEHMNPNEEVEEWLERFEESVSLQPTIGAATSAAAKDKLTVSYLLSNIGPEGYRLVKAYMAPDKPNTKSFAELKKCLLDNLAPKKSVISEAYKLSKLKQEANEKITIYMSRIKQLAAKCDYGNSYDRIVMDRFICGVKSEKLRAHLINDSSITTSALALTKALACENSDTAAHDMSCNYVNNKHHYGGKKKYNKTDNHNKATSSGKSNPGNVLSCRRCMLRGHKAADCRTRCRRCKKVGHIVKFCPTPSGKRISNVQENEPQVEMVYGYNQEMVCWLVYDSSTHSFQKDKGGCFILCFL